LNFRESWEEEEEKEAAEWRKNIDESDMFTYSLVEQNV